jgi:hypothetical protein
MAAVTRVKGIVAVAAVGCVLAGGEAAGQGPPRQQVSDTFTTQEPGAPSGRSFAVDFADPADPEGKPPAIARVELELAAGARFDTAAVPRCDASDAQLIAQGATACPARTRVGRGEILVDTGFPGPARFVPNDVTFFNARGALVILIAPRDTGARVVLRGRVAGRRLTIEVPPLPGTPPDGGANRRERATFDPSPYVVTPPVCPAGGDWVNRVTYTYRDGVRQTAESRSPCRAGAASTTSGRSGAGGGTASRGRTVRGVARPPASARVLNRRRSIGLAVRVDGTLTDVRARLVDRRGRTIAAARRASLTRDTRVRLRLRRRARAGLHRVVVTSDEVRATKRVRLLR